MSCDRCGREFPVAKGIVRCCGVSYKIGDPRKIDSRNVVISVGHRESAGEPKREAKPPSILYRFRHPSDIGLGDTIERLLAKFGAKRIERLLKRLSINCGCSDRRDWLNRKWPFRS